MRDHDHYALADEVMLVMRTKFRELESKDKPFDRAFVDVMKSNRIDGFEWHTIKVAIGKILSKRPRKPRAKSTKCTVSTTPIITLTVLEDSRKEIILVTSYGANLTMRRDVRGVTMCMAHTEHCSDATLAAAVAMATPMFAAHDRQAVRDYRVRVLRKERDSLELQLANKYIARVTQGKRGTVVMRVTLDGSPRRQNVLPKDIVDDARHVAKQYFKGAGTGTLPGM